MTPAPLRQFCVVTTGRHARTVRALGPLLAERGIAMHTWAWDRFLTAPALPRHPWVLTDFDRLHIWQLELGAIRAARLRAAGVVVLNDPARFRPRAALIRSLYRAGINSYTCWLPVEGEVPTRYPVFLRTQAAHRGTLTDLLADPAAAQAALAQALDQGHPLADLVFVEYRAEPRPGSGHFQKLAAYRVGEAIFPALSVNDAQWHAKHGVTGAASDADYAAELASFDAYPHDAVLRQVTDLAGVAYGRVDFALVAGRVEVYEINTNPWLGFSSDHPNPHRVQSSHRTRTALGDAFQAVLDAGGADRDGPDLDGPDLDPRNWHPALTERP